MATLPAGLTQGDIDRYARLDQGIKKLQEEHAVLNETIKKAHQDAGIVGNKTLSYPSDQYGTVIVKLGQQKRLDVKALEAAFPEPDYPDFYRVQFDKDLVAPDVQAAFRTNVVSTLSISVAE